MSANSRQHPQPSRTSQPPQLSEETIKQFLDNQRQSLEIQTIEAQNKRTELKLQEKEQDNGFVYAQQVLEAEKDDRVNRREHTRKQMMIRFGVALATLLIFGAIVVWAMEKDHPDIAKEIIKAILYITPSFLGGYGTRLITEKNQAGNQPQTPQQPPAP